MSPALWCSLLVMGGTSLLLQVLLVRELLTSFFGNELAIGVVLWNWLLLVAAGSSLAGQTRLGSSQAFTWLQLALAVWTPTALLLSRLVGGRTAFPGEVVTPAAMLGLSAAVLAPGCLLLGAQFVAGCNVWELMAGSQRSVARVYALEALGALLAGLLFHYVLADHVGPVTAALGLGLVNAGMAIWMLQAGAEKRACGGRAAAALIAAALLLGLAMRPLRDGLDTGSLQWRWRGFNLVSSQNTRFGNLALTRHGSQVSFFQDGSLLFTSEDQEASEWTAHLPLLQHPRPRTVLLVGGGYPSVAQEALKHVPPGYALKVIEANTALQQAARRGLRAFPSEGGQFCTLRGDARQVLRAGAGTYDVIIVCAPEPTTTALNRPYTQEFFDLARQRLNPGGILAVSLSGHEAYLTAERRSVHAAVYAALKAAFVEVMPVPGYRAQFLAASKRGVLTESGDTLARRLLARGIRTRFVDRFSLQTALMAFPRETYLRAIGDEPQEANRDLRPVVQRNYLRLWLRQHAAVGLAVLGLAERLRGKAPWLLLVAALVSLAGSAWPMRGVGARTGLFIAGVGFMAMGLQLVVMLSFQALAGYLYHQIGLLTALGMGGLAAGAWLGARPRLAAACGLSMTAFALAACALGHALGPALGAVGARPDLAPVMLGACAALLGVVTGAVFPLAVAFVGPRKRGEARVGGGLYAWDLLGGAIAALGVGLILIPAVGLAEAAAWIGNVGLCGVALVAPLPSASRRRLGGAIGT